MAVGTRADVGKALQTLRAFNKKAEKLEKFQFTKHVAKHGLGRVCKARAIRGYRRC